MLKRSFIGSGALALALFLSACGATPATPAAQGTTAPSTSDTLPTTDGTMAMTGTEMAGTASAMVTSGSAAMTGTASAMMTSGPDMTGTASAMMTSGPAAMTGTAGAMGNTILGAAAADPQFSTLVTLLEQSGLSQTLAGAGPFTVFAPTNTAFTNLPAGTLEALAKDPSVLQKILLYHVANGAVMSSDITADMSVPTAAGEDLKITSSGGKVMLNGKATVITADIAVGNGVIHAIDQVLVPPSVTLP